MNFMIFSYEFTNIKRNEPIKYLFYNKITPLMFYCATLFLFIVYFFCYVKAVKKPMIIHHENTYLRSTINSVAAFHRYFFPLIIYTKGYIESKVYQLRTRKKRRCKRITLQTQDGENLYVDIFNVRKNKSKITDEPNFIKKFLKKLYALFLTYNSRVKKENNLDFFEQNLDIKEMKNTSKNKTTTDASIMEDIPFRTHNNILLVHGFNASSSVSYIQNLAFLLQDYRIFALNARGTISQLNNEKFFHIGFTDDIGLTVNYILNNYTGTLALIGFSMGASWVTNYLSKQNSKRIVGGIGVCVPFDFYSLSNAQRASCISLLMALEFKKYLSRHKVFDKFDYKLLKTVEQIDSLVTTKIFNFNSLEEYYKTQSCKYALNGIKVPMLFINTKDDPLIPYDTIPMEEIKSNPFLVMCLLEAGGHLGLMDTFFQSSFLEIVVNDFLNHLNNKK
ncbi:hypothetical protein H312_00181 [Anncaliia algerae PRA339]|uniref:Serine aminopeptidase S33 domain-containing protein n=1 Tax=Anncaliia algerae PRA339 TaxID=1288291 RepID=A0A059F5H3_9MICR|nr:hypothetical protein H312_00181 [Anncaliia algerae PRA339]